MRRLWMALAVAMRSSEKMARAEVRCDRREKNASTPSDKRTTWARGGDGLGEGCAGAKGGRRRGESGEKRGRKEGGGDGGEKG